MPTTISPIPYAIVLLVLFLTYGSLVRRGLLAGRNIVFAGMGVGGVAVGASVLNLWSAYQRGLVPLPLLLFNALLMAVCAAFCVGFSVRSQRSEDVATFTLGDTKIIVRRCGPAHVPPADALVLPTFTTLKAPVGMVGALLAAAGGDVSRETRVAAPVGMGKVVVTSAGRLAVGKIFHVSVADPMRPIAAASLRRGVDAAIQQVRKSGAESVVIPLGPLTGLTVDEVATIIPGVLKQRKAFGEIVFVVLEPRHVNSAREAVSHAVTLLATNTDPAQIS